MKARWALSQNTVEPRRPLCGHCKEPVYYTGDVVGFSFIYHWVHMLPSPCDRTLLTDQKVVDQFGDSWWAR